MQRAEWRAGLAAVLVCCAGPALAVTSEGQALLEKKCGRCHAVTAEAKSPLKKAPNLWDTLRSYPSERLDVELAEGVGSHHIKMPQIQFTDEEITAIYYYLHGDDAGPKN